jgi:hypothetical protein
MELLLFCGPTLVPVLREVPPGASRLQLLLDYLIAGPTGPEHELGFSAAFPDPDAHGSVRNEEGRVTVDMDPSTFSLERFLASLFFIEEAVRENFARLPGVSAVELTVGGRDLCSIDPECSTSGSGQ